jgi:hypothetical protein
MADADDDLDARVSFRTSSATVKALESAAVEDGVVTRRSKRPNLSRMINSILDHWRRSRADDSEKG